ncbi:MAG: DNA polymerase III subunit gamma/tau [Fidelibacterota bacterium]
MSYQAISRKYRPQTFDEVIGQSHICATLKNAIKANRISHAYLFTGSRGIGKTSTARILAKSLNCLQPKGVDPCNECQNCKEITAGNSMDVLEIDGASNRGIDQIRDLRENVKYPPSNSKYRIFIIDEVHMLTKEAFNALLKTLEEPPSHVIFIFATTEPLKIPATIISRCQRYDFHRIPIREIADHLKKIAGKEQVEIAPEILMLLAKKAGGGMRDAESLLDQLIAFSGQSVSSDDAKQVLSLIDYDYYFDIGNKILANDTAALLQIAGNVIDEGINLSEFFSGFSEHFRNLLIAKSTGSVAMLDMLDDMKERYVEESQKWEVGDLLRLIKLINEAEIGLKNALNQRLYIEFNLFRLGVMTKTVTVEEILGALNNPSYFSKTTQVRETTDLFQSPDSKTAPVKNEPVKSVQERDKRIPPEQSEESRQTKSPIESEKSEITIDTVKEKWETLIANVASTNPSVASFLSMGQPEAIEGKRLTIVFRNGATFHLKSIQSKAALIEACLEKILGQSLKIKCIESAVKDSAGSDTETINTITRKVIDIFGGEIIPT